MKSMLQRLEEERVAYVTKNNKPPRVVLRNKSHERRNGTYYLRAVGSDHVELSSNADNETFLLDRSVMIEAFIV